MNSLKALLRPASVLVRSIHAWQPRILARSVYVDSPSLTRPPPNSSSTRLLLDLWFRTTGPDDAGVTGAGSGTSYYVYTPVRLTR